MNLPTVSSERNSRAPTDRWSPVDRVTEHLESGAEVVTELSDRVRDAAEEQTPAFVEEGIEKVRSNPGDEVRTQFFDRAVDEMCERLLDQSVSELQSQSELDADIDEQLDQAVDAFLQRYDLDRDRLDEETLAMIREQLASEAIEESELASLIADDSAELFSVSAGDNGGSSGFRPEEAYSQFCAELGIERDSDTVLDEILETDAIAVGHAIEHVVSDSRETPDQSAGFDDLVDVSQLPGASLSEAGVDSDTIRSTAAVTLALLTRFSTEAGGDQSLARVLPALASAVVGDVDPTATDDRLLEQLSNLGRADLDLETIRDRSSGSWALLALFIVNLVVMGIGAYVSRREAPPIPDEIRGPDGETIVTDEQVTAGKKAFQANGLMNHGSVLGNGSYFGADITADALELKAEFMREYYAQQEGVNSYEELDDDQQAAIANRVERELDSEAPEGSISRYSAAEAYAHRQIREVYIDRYHEGAPERGIPEGFVNSAEQAARIADFACWTAWMAHTNRPDSDHSYTNDWPYVPETGNRPTGQVVVWSTISLVLLVAGGGAGIRAYNTFEFAEPTTEIVDVPAPDSVSVTPTQYASAWYVPVAGALFVVQTLLGALLAHYYVERTGFFELGDVIGFDFVSMLPFSVTRTWHLNLGILWITVLWLAGGLFLPGLFSDRDLPWQSEAARLLLGILVTVTVAAFAGVWLGTKGFFGSPEDGELWWLVGSEGLEYLEVGRLWKMGLLAGLVGWTGLVLRSVRGMDEAETGLVRFLVYSGGSIALMFAASMFYTPETNMAVTEFWRWWVVHMWVEGVFEFFMTAVISIALVSMDLVEMADAEAAIIFEVFVIMGAGIVGVSHHYWWVGLPDIWVPLGTTFSTLEFVPLVFIFYRSLEEYRSFKAQGESFAYSLPLLFIVGSGIWNFVGGGVLGFFLNLPVINYFEHGTYLTVAHAHTATFGAFGLLALGLGTYILRVVTPESEWNPLWFQGTFWLTNIGLTVMSVASLLPVGFLQLKTAYSEGYNTARSLEFYEQDHVQSLLWARTLGDTPMILGALVYTAGAVRHLYAAREQSLDEG